MTCSATATGHRSGDILLVFFLGTVVMLFASFTTAYLIRRAGTDWAPITLPRIVWVNTGVLSLSSVLIERACRLRSRAWLLSTLGLGLVFLAGQLLAWSQLTSQGTGLGASAHGAFFYVLSAVHGLHVLGGLCTMLHVAVRGSPWRLTANYWHFMGVLWIYVLCLLSGV